MLKKPLSHYMNSSKQRSVVSDKQYDAVYGNGRKETKRRNKMANTFKNRQYQTNRNTNGSWTANLNWPILILLFVLLWVFGPLGKMLRSVFKGFGKGVTDYGNQVQLTEDQEQELLNNLQLSIGMLPHDKSFYDLIANNTFDDLDGPNLFGTPDRVFDSVKNLSADELKQVFVSFGYRAGSGWIIHDERGNIISWYQKDLSDWGDYSLTYMKEIWAKTGLPW